MYNFRILLIRSQLKLHFFSSPNIKVFPQILKINLTIRPCRDQIIPEGTRAGGRTGQNAGHVHENTTPDSSGSVNSLDVPTSKRHFALMKVFRAVLGT